MKKTAIPAAIFGLFLVAIYVFSSMTGNSNTETKDAFQNESAVTVLENSELISLLSIEDASERDHLLKQFFTDQIKKNPFTVIEMIQLLDDSTNRTLSYKIALTVWHDLDAVSLLKWLKNEDPRPDLDTALIHLTEANSLDIKYSLAYAEKIFDIQIQENRLSQLIFDWILIESEQIILWSIDPNQDRDTWLKMSFEVLTIDSLTHAINALSVLETGTADQRYIAIQTIIDNYTFGRITPETLTALQSLTPYEIREEVIGALLQLIAQEENISLDDLNTLLGSLLPGDAQDAYFEEVALNWAIKDPIEAAKYAESLTGTTRELALNGVVTSWIQTDLEATDEWLSALDGNLDLAANTIGRGSAQLGNISIADKWINHIEDEQIRTSAILDVIHGWYEESPEAGIYHLVYQKSLTAQEKLDILHQIYPGEVFISPNDALQDIGRLEGLSSPF